MSKGFDIKEINSGVLHICLNSIDGMDIPSKIIRQRIDVGNDDSVIQPILNWEEEHRNDNNPLFDYFSDLLRNLYEIEIIEYYYGELYTDSTMFSDSDNRPPKTKLKTKYALACIVYKEEDLLQEEQLFRGTTATEPDAVIKRYKYRVANISKTSLGLDVFFYDLNHFKNIEEEV